jgi:hypothetical protein
MVVRTDTNGAYLWGNKKWNQLVSAISMPAGSILPFFATFVLEIRIAPSNSSVFYMVWNDFNIYQSTNKGATWTKTNFTAPLVSVANNYRAYAYKMAIDPFNSNIVFCDVPSVGLYTTTTGGSSPWTAVPTGVGGVPPGVAVSGANPGINGIAFDPATVSGGVTQTIYAASHGNGVYWSTNAGSTWTRISSTLTDVSSGVVANGKYYVADQTHGLWVFTAGSPAQIRTTVYQQLVVDPTDGTHLIAFTNAGDFVQSFDSGTTWIGVPSRMFTAVDIPWLANAGPPFNVALNLGGVVWDTVVPGRLIVSGGVGVWDLTVPTKAQAQTPPTTTFIVPGIYKSRSAGLNNLTTQDIACPVSSNPVVIQQAFGVMTSNYPTNYPNSIGPLGAVPTPADSLDYAPASPAFVVVHAEPFLTAGKSSSGYSKDGGRTWTLFGTYPTGATIIPPASVPAKPGCIAVSTPLNFVWWPSGVAPSYTLDGGNNWTQVSIAGISVWDTWVYTLRRRMLVADSVTPGTFYLDNLQNGIYVSTNQGVSWTQVNSGGSAGDHAPAPNANANANMAAVPGIAGNLFYSSGQSGNGQTVPPGTQQLVFSNNGGTSWGAPGSLLGVSAFGFGAAAPGTDNPTMFACGWIGTTYGIWQSTDLAVTWTQIASFPGGSLQPVVCISGDPGIYGQVYVGFQGGGYAYLPGLVAA